MTVPPVSNRRQTNSNCSIRQTRSLFLPTQAYSRNHFYMVRLVWFPGYMDWERSTTYAMFRVKRATCIYGTTYDNTAGRPARYKNPRSTPYLWGSLRLAPIITLEVEPMVITVTLNYVRRIPALLSLHFVRRFPFFALGVFLRMLAVQR